MLERNESGATALRMVLAAHGLWVPLHELRDRTQVGRDGTTAERLAQVAAGYGMRARAVVLDRAGLDALPTPLIAGWAQGRFVVVRGWDSRGLLVNDPSTGARRVPWPAVEMSLSGSGVVMEPGSGFRPGGLPESRARRLAGGLRGYRGSLVFAVVVGLLAALPGVATAGFLAFFLNAILDQGQTALVWRFLLVVGVALAAQVGLLRVQNSTLVQATGAYAIAMASAMAWHTLRLPGRFFAQRSRGDAAWRLNVPSDVARRLSGPLPGSVIRVSTSLVFLVALAAISPWSALVALAIGVVSIGVARWVVRRQRPDQVIDLRLHGALVGETSSGLSSMEFIKASGSEQESFDRFTAAHAELVNVRQDTPVTRALITVPTLLSVLGSAAAIGIGAALVIDGQLSIGGLAALQILMLGFLAPLADVVNLGSQLSALETQVMRVEDVLAQEPEVSGVVVSTPGSAEGPCQRLRGEVEFRDVVFGYDPGGPPLLQGLSFIVRPGHRIAIVGTSGAGKSTVSRLLTGLVRPWEGQILLDGVPRDDIPPSVLTASLAMVDQRVVLFSGTVLDNLTLWDAGLPVDRAVAAARDAAIDSTIEARQDGYDSEVAEGARNFSGGEAQRVDIARALAGDPTILVLDEATSALDAAVEVDIDSAIRRRGCTTIVIAHRLSTIRDADLILVLDRGQVVESGTHDELMGGSGLYRSLVES